MWVFQFGKHLHLEYFGQLVNISNGRIMHHKPPNKTPISLFIIPPYHSLITHPISFFIFDFSLCGVVVYNKLMEGSPHKHKRTIAQDFLTKSLSQSIELNLSFARYSISSDHPGPLTLRVTHQAS